MTANKSQEELVTEAHLSIGAVSRATGIPADTLRTWERRYGFPTPHRTESGHRVYSVETTERLQRIAEALERGHRVSHVVGLPMAQLQLVLDSSEPPASVEPPHSPPFVSTTDSSTVEVWLEAVSNLDESRLKAHLQHAWSRYGAIRCLEDHVGPFLRELGRAWETGRLRVFHEHFASECVREFLSGHWRTLAEYNAGALALLTTLPGEEHNLGLHMVACALALAGMQLIFLGANTPVEDIITSAASAEPIAVVISVSYGVHTTMARRYLGRLRSGLGERVELVVGGGGIESVPDEVTRLPTLDSALAWAQGAASR